MKVFCNWPEARIVMALGIELKPGENEVGDDAAALVLGLDGITTASPVIKERGARKGSPEKE